MSDPKFTMIVLGRKVMTVDGARALLNLLPAAPLDEHDAFLARFCARKVEAAERIKERMLANSDDVEPGIRTGRDEIA